MTAIKRGDLLRTLRSKLGAEEDDQRRHIWFKIRIGGNLYATTMVSHGSETEIGQPLLGRIARQLRLTTADLIELVECSLDANSYYQMLASDVQRQETRPRSEL